MSLLAVLNLVSAVLGVGTASVYSNCNFDVFFVPITDQNAEMQLLGPNGFQMSYDQNLQDVGVSIKLGISQASLYGGAISQFEFTWHGNKIYWDLSNVNGNGNSSASYPFYQGGANLLPSMIDDPSNPTCEPVICLPGQTVCDAAYNDPNDIRTMICDQNSDLTLILCPGGTKQVRQPIRQYKHLSSHQHHRPPYMLSP